MAEFWPKAIAFCQNSCIFALAKKQMRIGNKFVEPANESPLTSLDRAGNYSAIAMLTQSMLRTEHG